MTLLDAKPPKPITGFRKHFPPHIIVLYGLLIAIIVGLLAFKFWDIRQERAVSNFLQTLEEGNYQEAYKLWQPAGSYSFDAFMRDWGEKGDYGKIREYDILSSKSNGGVVIVTVKINNVNPPLELAVNRKTLGLSFSPF